jgi:predicted nucleic acid-binding protein
MDVLTFVADTGPILHLHWVGASVWALPPNGILIVRTVAEEVATYQSDALNDPRFTVVEDPPAASRVMEWMLDAGETSALSFTVGLPADLHPYFLCDERRARTAARALGIPVLGSVGLILNAHRAGRVNIEDAAELCLLFPQPVGSIFTRFSYELPCRPFAEAVTKVNDTLGEYSRKLGEQ